MRCPDIISFHNGVIEWRARSGAALFVVSVNGENISDGADGFYRGTSYKLNRDRDARIKIAEVGGDGSISLIYNGKTQKLALAPVAEYALVGDRLEWNAVGGAAKYRVYDLDFNVTTVAEPYYEMSMRNFAWCVCPVPESELLCESEPVNVNIPYLDGDGTIDDPYLINSPLELRAIDYYETVYALCGGVKNHYAIVSDLDYSSVGTLEGESNIHTLKKPFFGVLDGRGKRLSHICVRYDGGYWALFDYIAVGGRVENIIFDNADIYNRYRDDMHPVNSTTAAVAFINNGELTGIILDGVRITAAGGGVCGIAAHNGGEVSGCTVSGAFMQDVTSGLGSASYEMSGVVLENRAGGRVCGNIVSAALRGTGDNIRAVAGVVSVNRGGIVKCNSFDNITIGGKASGAECGGVVAYNSGIVERGDARLGTLVVDGGYIDRDVGGELLSGKLVGKNDGKII